MPPPAPTLVRRLTAEDWSMLRDVRLAALAEAPQSFGSTLAREQEFDETTWRSRTRTSAPFVAEVEGVAVGMASAWHEKDMPPTEQHLVAMWVDPAHRRRGIAELLVRAVADWSADEAGATELSLWVAEGNDAARLLYERLGFRSTDVVAPRPSDATRCERRMVRSLPWEDD